jgi:hypothetical protein
MLAPVISVVPPTSRIIYPGIHYNMGKTIINHPPVIAIFIDGINHSQSWVIYGIVLPTLININH